MANSVDPDQTPHSAASDLSIPFAQACLSQYLELLRYFTLEAPKRVIGKQCRSRSDAAECRV